MKLTRAASLTATFVALGLSLQAKPAAVAASPPTRPNIVIIVSDDQDYDSLPVMRRLLSYPEGSWVNFTNAMGNYSLCTPARTTFLTGQYAYVHGLGGNWQTDQLNKKNTLPV